jgi:hypothetical protein
MVIGPEGAVTGERLKTAPASVPRALPLWARSHVDRILEYARYERLYSGVATTASACWMRPLKSFTSAGSASKSWL